MWPEGVLPYEGGLPFYSNPFKTFWDLEFIKSRLSIPLSPSEKKELGMNGAIALLRQFTCSPCGIVPADT